MTKHRKITVTTDGKPGKNGKHGQQGTTGTDATSEHAGSPGGHGGDGTNGTAGHNAANITLELTADNNIITVKTEGREYNLALGDANASVTTSAKGGDGGDGGNAGPGGCGGRGFTGNDATTSRVGTNGTQGGQGGNAGLAGNGADGGNGGHVTYKVDKKDLDLLLLINTPDVTGGAPGLGGKAGSKGAGGNGGFGGFGKDWVTYIQRTQMVPQTTIQIISGRPVPMTSMVPRMHTEPVHHHQNSGWKGKKGHSGNSSPEGKDGKAGQDGRFQIIVTSDDGETSYPGVFELRVDSYEFKSENKDKIFEPGETLKLYLTLKNVGPMPSPANKNFTLSLKSHALIEEASEVALTRSIGPGESYRIQTPLKIKLSEEYICSETPYKQSITLEPKLMFTRVNKEVAAVAKTTLPFDIQFPLEQKTIRMPDIIAHGFPAKLTYQVNNASTKPIGIDYGRDAYVTVEERPQGKKWSSKIAGKEGEHYEGDLHEINLPGQHKEQHDKVFHLSHHHPNQADEVKFVMKLWLKSLHDDKMNCIQKEEFNIKQVETYRQSKRHPFDVLLVVHDQVLAKEIQQWQDLFESWGLNVAIWNLSLYKNMSLRDTQIDSRLRHPLMMDLVDKLVVMCNTPFTLDNKAQTPFQMLDTEELVEAMIDKGAKVYVVGGQLDYEKVLHTTFTSQPKDVEGLDELLKEKTKRKTHVHYEFPLYAQHKILSLKQAEAHLEAYRQKTAERLEKHFPGRNYILEVVPENISCKICEKPHTDPKLSKGALIGRMKVHPSLSNTDQHLKHFNIKARKAHHLLDHGTGSQDFQIVKMLTFQRKLELGRKINSYEQKGQGKMELLYQAILSDLLEFLKAYLNAKWTGPLNRQALSARLTILDELFDYKPEQFTEYEHLLNTMIMIKCILKLTMSRKDKVLPHRRHRKLYDIFNERFKDWLKDIPLVIDIRPVQIKTLEEKALDLINASNMPLDEYIDGLIYPVYGDHWESKALHDDLQERKRLAVS